MPLFKEVKKPKIRQTAAAGAEISPLRPRYQEKTPPCISHCPNETNIRDWITMIAQAEAYGRSKEQVMELAWKAITDVNPFPAVCGRVCPHPCEANCNRKNKDGAVRGLSRISHVRKGSYTHKRILFVGEADRRPDRDFCVMTWMTGPSHE